MSRAKVNFDKTIELILKAEPELSKTPEGIFLAVCQAIRTNTVAGTTTDLPGVGRIVPVLLPSGAITVDFLPDNEFLRKINSFEVSSSSS